MLSCPLQLLFTDTFSESSSFPSGCILEHIQFQHPVYACELRVVLNDVNIKVQDFVIKGKTSLSKGEIVIYGLNLNKRKDQAATFEFLARFNIDANQAWRQFKIEKQIPTSRLIIRSDLKLLTIAIVGVLARKSNESLESSLPRAALLPSELASTESENISDTSVDLLLLKCNLMIDSSNFEDSNEIENIISNANIDCNISSDSDEDFSDMLNPENIEKLSMSDVTKLSDTLLDFEYISSLDLKKFDLKLPRRHSIHQCVRMINDLRFDYMSDFEIFQCLNWLNDLSSDTLASTFDLLPNDQWHKLLNLIRRCADVHFVFAKLLKHLDSFNSSAINEIQRYQLRVWSNSVEIIGLIMSMDISPRKNSDIDSHDFTSVLLDILDHTFLTSTFQMRIIRSLDRSLSSFKTMKRFTQKNQFDPQLMSPYDRCVKWLVNFLDEDTRRSRPVILMSRLLNKVHYFYELELLCEYCKRFLKANPLLTVPTITANLCKDSIEAVQWIVSFVVDCNRSDDEVLLLNQLVNSLDSIATAVKFASMITELPSKTSFRRISKLSGSLVGKAEADQTRDRKAILNFINECDLLSCISSVIAVVGSAPNHLFDSIEMFVKSLFYDLSGIEFFIQNKSHFIDIARWMSRCNQVDNQITCLIAYGIQSLTCLNNVVTVKQGELYNELETLFVISNVDQVGGFIMSCLISEKPYYTALFAILSEHSSDKDPIFRIVVQLLVQCLINMDDHKSSYALISSIMEFANDLWNKVESSSSKQIKLCAEYLFPCTLLKSYTATDAKILSESLHNLMASTENFLKPRIAMTLKILCVFCVPCHMTDIQLSHKLAICELYSADGLVNLCCILEHIYLKFHQSWQLGLPFDSECRLVSDYIVRSSIVLIREILKFLKCSSTSYEHKNMNPIRHLFRIFCILPACLSVNSTDRDVELIRSYIIECFKTYMIFYPDDVFSKSIALKDHDYKASGWCLMLMEICKCTLSVPKFFISGLSILSFLLPPTLPIFYKNSDTSIINRVVNKMRSDRKQIAVHFAEVKEIVFSVIEICALFSSPWLQQVVRRFCSQLADLSPDLCIFSIKSIFNLLISETTSNSSNDDESQNALLLFSSTACSLLSLLCTLMSVPSCKSAFLILINSKLDFGDHYFEQFCKIIDQFNIPSENTHHLFCQTAIISMLESLCDPAITMVSNDVDSSDNQSLNNLPSVEAIEKISKELVNHIGDHNHTYTSTALATVCLTQIFTEYPGGNQIVRRYLIQFDGVLCNLIEKLDCKFDKDNVDYINALSVTMNFLDILISNRGHPFSNSELRKLLNWIDKSNSDDHALTDFISLLSAIVEDKECHSSRDSTCNDIFSILLKCLQRIKSKLDAVNLEVDEVESNLKLQSVISQTPEKLVDQFDKRCFVDDKAQSQPIRFIEGSSWYIPKLPFSEQIPIEDNFEDLSEMVSYDFDSLLTNYCKSNLPGVSVLEVLNQEYDEAFACLDAGKHYKISDKIIATSQGPGHRNYVAPMRGFGFSRNIINRSFLQNRVNSFSHSILQLLDPFRTRSSSSASRPPSLHVDEFYNFEHQNVIFNPFHCPPDRSDGTAMRQANFMMRRELGRRAESSWNMFG
ncbi:hypothetical protein GJ496_006483 [Pomphorhynchus laevis]|nr:hypothetical protein GJ496_006483 [Pomphorhynchus laevis]